MNDLEVILLLVGSAVTCYYIGRYVGEWQRKKNLTENNKEWTKVHNLTIKQRDNLILTEHRQRKALEFYAEAGNWMSGKVTTDGGDKARVAIGDLRVAKSEVAA